MKNQTEFPFSSWLQNIWNKKGLSLNPQCFQSTHCCLVWNYSNNAAQNPFHCLLCNSSLKDITFSLGLEFGSNSAGSAWSGQHGTCWDQWKLASWEATPPATFPKESRWKQCSQMEKMIPFFPPREFKVPGCPILLPSKHWDGFSVGFDGGEVQLLLITSENLACHC